VSGQVSNTRDVERLVVLRREAERLVRDLFQTEPQADNTELRLVADMLTEDERYVIEVELAGVAVGDVEVFALGDTLVVEGRKSERRPAGTPSYDRAERAYGRFRRVFDLPGPGDLSRTTATLGGGILTIIVPRIVDRRNRPRPVTVVKGQP
jgi:HSP20 family protein